MEKTVDKHGNPVYRFEKRFFSFCKGHIVLVIAFVLAVATSFIVPPDSEYLSYFDFKTLSCLFSTLAVVCALKNIRFFTKTAEKIVLISGNARTAVIMLVYITFIGSMLIANDMALLTFLPLGYYVLYSGKCEKYMAFTFIMQNIAANLGGMLTPFGNPQNLYLYEKFSIGNAEFVRIMLFPFLFAVFLITVCCLFVPKKPLEISSRDYIPLPKVRTAAYIFLFLLSIMIVMRILPYYIGLPVIAVSVLILDRKALARVDYPLLLTFCAFFVFAGNMSRIPSVNGFLSSLLLKNTLVVSSLSCQFISNVPSAILLSEFTDDYRSLLMGVNIGGCGTIISSLASLITFCEYKSHYRESSGKYLLLFSALNFAFLMLLLIFSSCVLATENFGLGF